MSDADAPRGADYCDSSEVMPNESQERYSGRHCPKGMAVVLSDFYLCPPLHAISNLWPENLLR